MRPPPCHGPHGLDEPREVAESRPLDGLVIALVSPGYPPDQGGVEATVRLLARQLQLDGARVGVFAYGRIRETQVVEGIPVMRFRSYLKQFAVAPALFTQLLRTKAMIWHVHGLHSSLPLMVWLSGRRPYVLHTHFHGQGHTRAARAVHIVYRPVAARIVRSAARVIAVSEEEASIVRQQFGVSVVVVPNGIDAKRMAAIKQRTKEYDEVQLLVVSRLEGYKQVDLAIRCLTALPENHVLTVVGRGPELGNLQRLALTLGIQDRVRFESSFLTDPELWQLVADSAVSINLSNAEAFSMSVLESLALGTPVVIGGAPGLRQWAERFPEDVRVVDSPRPEVVAAAVLGISGRRVHVDLAEYDMQAIAKRLAAIYRSVVRGDHRSNTR